MLLSSFAVFEFLFRVPVTVFGSADFQIRAHKQLRTISKHLLRTLDTSCKQILPPGIKNGKLLRLKKRKSETDTSKRLYLVAEFKCHAGYVFEKSHSGKMFCSRGKWIGKIPVCEPVSMLDTNGYLSDSPIDNNDTFLGEDEDYEEKDYDDGDYDDEDDYEDGDYNEEKDKNRQNTSKSLNKESELAKNDINTSESKFTSLENKNNNISVPSGTSELEFNPKERTDSKIKNGEESESYDDEYEEDYEDYEEENENEVKPKVSKTNTTTILSSTASILSSTATSIIPTDSITPTTKEKKNNYYEEINENDIETNTTIFTTLTSTATTPITATATSDIGSVKPEAVTEKSVPESIGNDDEDSKKASDNIIKDDSLEKKTNKDILAIEFESTTNAVLDRTVIAHKRIDTELDVTKNIDEYGEGDYDEYEEGGEVSTPATITTASFHISSPIFKIIHETTNISSRRIGSDHKNENNSQYNHHNGINMNEISTISTNSEVSTKHYTKYSNSEYDLDTDDEEEYEDEDYDEEYEESTTSSIPTTTSINLSTEKSSDIVVPTGKNIFTPKAKQDVDEENVIKRYDSENSSERYEGGDVSEEKTELIEKKDTIFDNQNSKENNHSTVFSGNRNASEDNGNYDEISTTTMMTTEASFTNESPVTTKGSWDDISETASKNKEIENRNDVNYNDNYDDDYYEEKSDKIASSSNSSITHQEKDKPTQVSFNQSQSTISYDTTTEKTSTADESLRKKLERIDKDEEYDDDDYDDDKHPEPNYEANGNYNEISTTTIIPTEASSTNDIPITRKGSWDDISEFETKNEEIENRNDVNYNNIYDDDYNERKGDKMASSSITSITHQEKNKPTHSRDYEKVVENTSFNQSKSTILYDTTTEKISTAEERTPKKIEKIDNDEEYDDYDYDEEKHPEPNNEDNESYNEISTTTIIPTEASSTNGIPITTKGSWNDISEIDTKTKEIENRNDVNYNDKYDDDYNEKKGDKISSSSNSSITHQDKDEPTISRDFEEVVENANFNQSKSVILYNTTTAKITRDDKISPKRIEEIDKDEEYDDDVDDDDYDEEKKHSEPNKEESMVVEKGIEKEIDECEEGFILDQNNKCADIDECNPDTNPCSDICENTISSYTCRCSNGYKLSSADYHVCQDIDECLENPCSHICKNLEGSYRCDCPTGLSLQNTSCVNLTCSHGETKINGKLQCTCPPGYVLGFDNRTCEDVDECLLFNDCSHNCQNNEGSYSCSCREGFILENGKICVDIDECQGKHGCSQVCENTPGSFKCSCQEGYEHNILTNSCVDINECDERRDLDECNQICINYDGGYECGCRTGFKLASDDSTCEDVNECSLDNGNCTHICTNLLGTFTCECKQNYVLEKDNKTCTIVNPCLEENGGCSHQCINDNGMVECRCPLGHILEEKECFLRDPCVLDNGKCSHICVNANGAVRCECPQGYELKNQSTCYQINPCTRNNGNCSHFCEFVDGHVNCLCPELYSLRNATHCLEINPCEENNGGCSHFCHFENHKQTCSCPLTHQLHNQTYCFEQNPCFEENGGCSDTCEYFNGTVSCGCPENYYLEGKICYRIDPCLIGNGGCSHDCFSDEDRNVQCSCPVSLHLQTDGKSCIPNDLCLLNNGNCSHICDSTTGPIMCSCPEGYTLRNSTHCIEYNPCSIENGGCSHICENSFGKVRCSCPQNYVLLYQKKCEAADLCEESNGGCSHYCKTIDREVKCSCPDHHNLVNKTTCLRVNPCFINNGGCSHECATEGNKVICLCREGHQLEGKKCLLINPCDHKNGGCSHICSSVNGQVVCKCPPDFELINKTCFKINPCLINNGECSHGCTNVRGFAKCTCPPGYKLFGKKCMDEDPCVKNNGGCSHICRNKEGKRECSCPPGYLLRPNRRVCKEVNECRVNRGGCSHGCKNVPGSYQCTCPHGLKLDNSRNKTCIDIDECQMDNGKCEMICRNFKGGHKCDCPEGYFLQKDRRSCRLGNAEQCRVPSPPKNGIWRCLDHRTDYSSFVPSGTKCNAYCNEGYKLIGQSQRLCNSAGTWENGEPHCVVATCPKLPPIQNGWYLPGVCNSGRTYSGESCEIYCRKGFIAKQDVEKYVCDSNMQWMPNVRPEQLRDACVRNLPDVNIRCPKNGHIEFILPPGQRHTFVKIPRPETNIDWNFVTSQPSWATRLENTLPAGRTEVRFTAVSPSDFNSSASCHLVINVLDKELPKTMRCPENIERTIGKDEHMQIVHWMEPEFQDNVGIATVYKSREPGSEFGLGLHHITYVASDEAGNRAFCHFSINIRDDLQSEESNIIKQHPSTYTNHQTAGKYRAVLICPSGVQYMSSPPDNYNNMLTSEAGCYWRHVKVTRPMQPQSFKVPPRVYSESRLPDQLRRDRRVFFKWSR